MEKLPKWFMTPGLPTSNDYESATCMEQTYKVYQAMQTLIEEYNKFANAFNQEWEQFVNKYNNDLEVFTLAMRQEFQDFIDVVDTKLAGVDYFEEEIANIKAILQTNDVNLDTLQELVDSLKNNVNSVEEIFSELNKKANKSELDAKQDKLVAGEGIKIEGNTIRATGGGSGGGTEVIANEELDGTEEKLNSLTIDGTRYNVNKLKLVAEGTYSDEESRESSKTYILNVFLKANQLYLIKLYCDGVGQNTTAIFLTEALNDAVRYSVQARTNVLWWNEYDAPIFAMLSLISLEKNGDVTNQAISVTADSNDVIYGDEYDVIKIYELPFSL